MQKPSTEIYHFPFDEPNGYSFAPLIVQNRRETREYPGIALHYDDKIIIKIFKHSAISEYTISLPGTEMLVFDSVYAFIPCGKSIYVYSLYDYSLVCRLKFRYRIHHLAVIDAWLYVNREIRYPLGYSWNLEVGFPEEGNFNIDNPKGCLTKGCFSLIVSQNTIVITSIRPVDLKEDTLITIPLEQLNKDLEKWIDYGYLVEYYFGRDPKDEGYFITTDEEVERIRNWFK